MSPYYNFYFHPDENDVLDPTEGRVHMFYRGSILYLGLDTDDQAVNGQSGESGRDGFRLIIRSRDSTNANQQADNLTLDFSVDSTGAVRYNRLPEEVEAGTDVVAAVSLKGSSTVADPSDIDQGYQIEVALDLNAIGYGEEANADASRIWVSITYFDGDSLEDATQSYSTRSSSMGERTNGASIMAYLDPNALIVTSGEGAPEVDALTFTAAYPNPTTGLATIRYELVRAADVTVEVFDVLGRKVQTVEAGAQAPGLREVSVDGRSLRAGAYIVRVSLDAGTSVTGRMLVTR